MNTFKMTVLLLFLGGLSLSGCERLQETPLSAEAEACRVQIVAFRSNVGLNGTKMLRKRREICEQTLALTNVEERTVLFREFVKEFYKIDISHCTVSEATDMLYDYYSNCEYLAYCLMKSGGSREEVWRTLVTGLEKYKQLCFSFGDENDMSDGWLPEARTRRHFAEWGRKSWNGCLLLCRDRTIKRVFGADKDTIERLQARLEKEFGKIEEKRSR